MVSSVSDYILERLTPIYGIDTGVGPDRGSVGELLKRWWSGEGNLALPTNQKLFDRYTLAGAVGASLQDKAYDFWSRGLLKSGVKLPGTAGNYISTPDSVLNSITGDIDIRMFIKPDSWMPASLQRIISKSDVASLRSFTLGISTNGTLAFSIYPLGTVTPIFTRSSTIAPGFVDGTAHWVRVAVDVDNGAGQHVYTFYTSEDGLTWALLGASVINTGVISIFDGTMPIELGSRANGSNEQFTGTIYYAEVRNGIDGPVVVKFDSSQVQVSGAMLPASINGWKWNGSALYKRDDYVRLPGTAGNYLSYPDTAANSVTGDIDLRCKVSMDDWTPAAVMVLVSKNTTNQFAYQVHIDTAGKLVCSVSGNGITATLGNCTSTSALGFVDGSVWWVRFTRDSATGVILLYTSSDGVTWTNIADNAGTEVAGPGFDSTALLMIGSNFSGSSNMLAGNVYYAEVRNGINGPVVASFNAADFADVQTPWTINGTGWSWEGSSFTGKPVTVLQLPNLTTDYLSTPDTAGNSVTGDLDLRMKLGIVWSQASQALLGKWDSGAKSFLLTVGGSGVLYFYFTNDGATAVGPHSSVAAVPFVDNGVGWIRLTRVQSSGLMSYFTSLDGIIWTPLGTPSVVSAGVAIADTTALLRIGSQQNTWPINGKVYYAEVRNGINGPIVAKFDATNIARTGVRTPTTTVQPGGTPNLLTPNQASIETDATGWLAQVNCSVAQDATQFLDGTKSLSMTATAIGASGIGTTPSGVNGTKVIEDKLYTAICSMRAATVGRATKIVIKWYDAAGASLGFSGNGASTDVTTGWTVATISGVAPNGAVTAELQITVNDVLQALGEVHYVDRVSLVEAAELWSIQGSAWDLVQVA